MKKMIVLMIGLGVQYILVIGQSFLIQVHCIFQCQFNFLQSKPVCIQLYKALGGGVEK